MGFLSAPVDATADQVYDFVMVRNVSVLQRNLEQICEGCRLVPRIPS